MRQSPKDPCSNKECKHPREDHFEVGGKRCCCSVQWCPCNKFVEARGLDLYIGGVKVPGYAIEYAEY